MADPRTAHRRLARLTARQHGLFTRRQARGCGLTDRQIDRRLGSGLFVPHRPGVLLIAGVPSSWEQAVQGGVMACGPLTLAAGPTGARVWDTTPRPPAQGIHVLTPTDAGRARRPGIIAARSSLIVAADRSRHRDIDVTSPARTLADCSGLMDVDELGSALDDAVRRNLLTLEAMRSTAARLMTPGRPRANLARVLAARLPGYDPGDSDLEVDAMARIRRAGLALPVQQHPVVVEGRTLHVDLAYPDLMIGIELDGWEWHSHRTSFDRDRHRLSWLAAAGWAMLVPTTETIGDLVPQLLRLIPRRRDLLARSGDGQRATNPVAR